MNKVEGPAATAGSTSQWTEQELRLITEGQQRIKASMPEVYKTICRFAAKDKNVWRSVRMGLAGRSNCFWAAENGHMAGAPFIGLNRSVEMSRLIARMGCAHVCMIAGHLEMGI